MPASRPKNFLTSISDRSAAKETCGSFSGSGITTMAAERVGRRARALEIEPRFVDVAIRRWQAFARRDARHAESGLSFDEIAAETSRSLKLASRSDEAKE
jgi:hypothetical protein